MVFTAIDFLNLFIGICIGLIAGLVAGVTIALSKDIWRY